MENFKTQYSFEERKAESEKIKQHWPDKIPIVAEKAQGSFLKPIQKSKILCPCSFKVYQFLASLRTKLDLSQRDSLFVFFNNQLILGDRTISEVYTKGQDPDGFLYVTYSEHENLGN